MGLFLEHLLNEVLVSSSKIWIFHYLGSMTVEKSISYKYFIKMLSQLLIIQLCNLGQLLTFAHRFALFLL